MNRLLQIGTLLLAACVARFGGISLVAAELPEGVTVKAEIVASSHLGLAEWNPFWFTVAVSLENATDDIVVFSSLKMQEAHFQSATSSERGGRKMLSSDDIEVPDCGRGFALGKRSSVTFFLRFRRIERSEAGESLKFCFVVAGDIESKIPNDGRIQIAPFDHRFVFEKDQRLLKEEL